MSYFCIFVCFLALVASVHSRHYVRFSYEELKDDEEKDSVPMAELIKPLNALRFQQEALRLTSFHWDNCDKPSQAMTISSLVVSPDPIQEGAVVHVTVQGTMDETVSSPIEVNLQLKYHFISWINVPCKEIGTCDYPDICTKLPAGTCPFKKGPFNFSKSFPVPTSPYRGKYELTVNVMSHGALLTCVRVDFSLSS